MKKKAYAIGLSILMLLIGASQLNATFNESDTKEELSEPQAQMHVILPTSQHNFPGFQEGSVFSESTIATGYRHSCAVVENGSVYCWGDNSNGQLGTGNTNLGSSNTPVQVASFGNGRTATEISAGIWHTCAILDNGSVSCWGYGPVGQLGLSTQTRVYAPMWVDIGQNRTATQISTSNQHTCAILDNGSVKCWGDNANQQLGYSTSTNYSSYTPVIVNLGTGVKAQSITTGYDHTCAITTDGLIRCWGGNSYGQLGGAGLYSQSIPVYVTDVESDFKAVAVEAGGWFTCAMFENHEIECWGRTSNSRLGVTAPNTDLVMTPMSVDISGVDSKPISITTGMDHACLLSSSGKMYCWGSANNGKLGSSSSYTGKPILVDTINQSSAVVAGWEHTCATLRNGSIYCWGQGTWGQLGIGNTQSYGYPAPLSNSQTIKASLSERDFDGNSILNIFQTRENLDYKSRSLAAGGFHTCSIIENGSIACAGYNGDDQLGAGNGGVDQRTPILTKLANGVTATQVVAGYDYTCAILGNGSINCWGDNSLGQLGDGTFTDRTVPSYIPTSRDAIDIAAGSGRHTCAIFDNGSLYCWGYATDGQLGIGSTSSKNSPMFVNLGVGRTAVDISTGASHTCAILDNGSVKCWGDNSKGQLGDGTLSQRTTPTLVTNLGGNAISLSLGDRSSCALLDDGIVKCWGRNDFGQLGDSTTTDRKTPTQVSSFGTGRTAIAITSGLYHSCAILDNKSISCWGYNDYGQLGDGTTSTRSSPVTVINIENLDSPVSISSSYYHTCLMNNSGSIHCWGYNNKGQFGNGDNPNTWNYLISKSSSISLPKTPISVSGSCAILSDQTAKCWGSGESFPEPLSFSKRYSTYLSGNISTNITNISTYSGHKCALSDAGDVYCWGTSSAGQLGANPSNSNSRVSATSPVLVNGFGNFGQQGRNIATQVSVGGYHTCAILDTGLVKCWGANVMGQLGDGTTSLRKTPTPTTYLDGVSHNRTAVKISAGRYGTCAILDDGNLSCWGKVSSYPVYYNPTIITPAINQTVVDVSVGYSHMCVITSNGTLMCWGENSHGQLGIGSNTHNYSPNVVDLGTGITARSVFAHSSYTCVILSNNNTKCWGLNSYGQLGDGTTTSRNTPTLVSLPSQGYFVSISLSSSHACGILDDYTVLCWGDNSAGQLGDGTNISRKTPTPIESLDDNYSSFVIDSDIDRDGFSNHIDPFANDPYRSVDCSAGTSGRYLCLDAPVGKIVQNSSSVYPSDCLAGTYQPLTKQTSCVNASVGHYVANISQSYQNACTAGSYQPLSAQSSCNYADPGHYVSTNGQTSQTACPAGTYNPNVGSSSFAECLAASPGYYVPMSAQSNQTACPSGTYNPNAGSSSLNACLSADIGYFVPISAQSSQTACVAGTYQPLTGQSSCSDAEPGYYVPTTAQSSQTPSDAGYFVPISAQSSQTPCSAGTYQPLSAQSSCNDSDSGYFVPTIAQSSQSPCIAGTYQPLTKQSNCMDADPGHYVPTSAQSIQTPCLVGTYNPNSGSISSSACLDADPGYYVPATGQSSQTACVAGTYNPNVGSSDASECINAERGHFVPTSAQSSQTECLAGTYQPYTRQTTCIEADPGYYVSTNAQFSQTACLAGTYNPNQASSSSDACVKANLGYFVPTSGQSSQTACVAGTYQSITGQSTCSDADMGYFVQSSAQSSQTACSAGSYQPLTGQSSCKEADPGYYVPIDAQSIQTACFAGTYNPYVGASSISACIDADRGYFVAADGQSSQTACLAGTFNPHMGSSSSTACLPAEPGFYVPTDAKSSQIACLAGTYNPNGGSSSSNACLDAQPGYFVPAPGQSSQTACSAGSYNPTTAASDATACVGAGPGFFVPEPGQANQTECPLGSFQPNNSGDSCLVAEIGFYVDTLASDRQSPCPAGKSTIRNSSISVEDCSNDLDFDKIPDSVDDDIDGDNVSNFIDRFPLDPYEWLDSDNDGEGDNSDTDDDNDGWSDVEEKRQGTNPLDSTESPVDGFEIIVPGTKISLGAWDLIGILAGVPLFVWISFGLITRTGRGSKFEEALANVETSKELEEISSRIDLCLTLRLLSVPQGIHLTKLRDEAKERFIEVNNKQSGKTVPQLPAEDQNQDVPSYSDKGVVGNDGYEWLEYPASSGKHFYRVPGSGAWEKWE